MADPVTIAQTGVDPATGSYLSAERRKAIFRSTRVSGFSGGGGGNVEPQTSAIVKRQANEIVQLKKEINTIQKAQTAAATTFQQTISGIQSFLGVIGVNVRDLGGRILGVNNLLTTDANLEARKDRQELAQEKKLAEQGARAGKEKLLEQRIQNAMMAPIKMVTAKTQGIFQRLMQAFTFFFLGWLTNKVIATLQDQTGKTENIFKRIFDSIIGGVTFFLKSLVMINKTFRGIIGIVTGITKLIAKFISSTLGLLFKGLGKLGQSLVDAGKGLFSAVTKTATKEGAEALTKTAGKEGAEALTKVAGKEGAEALTKTATKEAAEGLLKIGGKRVPIAGLVIGGGFAGIRASQGQYGKAALELLSGALGPFGLPIDAWLAYDDIQQGLKENKKAEQQKPKQTSAQKPAAASMAPTPAAQPLSPAIPSPTPSQTNQQTQAVTQPATTAIPEAPAAPSADMAQKFQMAWDNRNNPLARGRIESAWNNMSSEQQQQAKTWAETKGYNWNEMKLTPKVTNIQAPPKPVSPVGPEPEQKPNIVMMSSITPQSQASSTILKSSPGNAASDVPSIPSANPSNFYTLYSQVNYNVVV